MLGGYLRILGTPSVQPVAPYRYLLPNLYLSVADIANPDLCACGSRTWISLDIARFYEEHCENHPAGPHGRPAHKTVTQFAHGLPDRCDSTTACRMCRLEPCHFSSVSSVATISRALNKFLLNCILAL